MTDTVTRSVATGEPTADRWVDVRMTDPEEGEWTVDAVVVDGAVEYVDLRVRHELLASFVACLLKDVDVATARDVLTDVADRRGIDFAPAPASDDE